MERKEASREVHAEFKVRGSSTVSVSASVKHWQRFDILLQRAKELSKDFPEAAIVLAQTACEVCTEVVVNDAVDTKVSDEDIATFIKDEVRKYYPTSDNTQLKRMYKLLFDEDIREKKEQLWTSFDAHNTRRNDVVHHGKAASTAEAEESIKAVEAVIDRLLPDRT